MGTKKIVNNKGQIIGTWALFDEMNDIALAYNLGDLLKEELEKVRRLILSGGRNGESSKRRMYIGNMRCTVDKKLIKVQGVQH